MIYAASMEVMIEFDVHEQISNDGNPSVCVRVIVYIYYCYVLRMIVQSKYVVYITFYVANYHLHPSHSLCHSAQLTELSHEQFVFG